MKRAVRLPHPRTRLISSLHVAGILMVPLVLLATARTSTASAQTVLRPPNPAASLSDRWKWARDEAHKRGIEKGYWIGYSIERQMMENSYIGSLSSDPRQNRPALNELITGSTQIDSRSPGNSGSFTVNGNVTLEENHQKSHQQVTKEVGILFHFTGGSTEEPDRTKLSNLSLRVDLEEDPLLWLGGTSDGASIDFLKSRYALARSTESQKEIVKSIGLHQASQAVFAFLRDRLTSREPGDVREEAAFWLGQLNTDEALGVLMHVAQTDGSDQVRDKAVFGISQMEGDRGLDALIKLARESTEGETGKKAAFWLGQRASQKAVATLKDIVYSGKDTDLQKNALFALTQCSDGGAIDDVIKIAKTHPNPKIRKEAIFWLGQSEDKRAVEALIEIVRQ